MDAELDIREIGDMDEGVVEGGEDTGYAEDELACCSRSVCCPSMSGRKASIAYPRGPGDRAEHSPARRARLSSWGPCLMLCVVIGRFDLVGWTT